MKTNITPYSKKFPGQLKDYVEQVTEAIAAKKHHDHRRWLFMNFMRDAFDIEAKEIEIESKLKGAEFRGYIDALYQYIIFEFKTDLRKEHGDAEYELTKYFRSRQKPDEYIAVVTDGLTFETVHFDTNEPRWISSFTLTSDDPHGAHRFLDSLFFSAKRITPTSEDITTRFGLESAIFNRCRLYIEEMFEQVKVDSSVKVKFSEWNSLLRTVYGEEIGDNRLFINHTYLAMLARLMVASALFPKAERVTSFYRGVMNGDFFRKSNLLNLVEPDFFCWAMDTVAEKPFLGLLAKIEQYLSRFTFAQISEDLLKEIYQELVDRESRHSLGEYYTPDWIADLCFRRLRYQEGSVLDPACGSGTFLLAAIRRLRELGMGGAALVNYVTENISGIDVHPLAVIMSKANILLSLTREIRRMNSDVHIPVYMADSLLLQESASTRSIEVPVSEDEHFHIPLASIETESDVDTVVDTMTRVSHNIPAGKKGREQAWEGLQKTVLKSCEDHERFLWRSNFMLMCQLVSEQRNTVWGFILKNAYRPAYLRKRKVDYVVGNPPWLSYRYIRDAGYKKRVKDLALKFELLGKKDVKLFTQLDTSTLFFVYSEAHFLKEGGTIAFVLPKTTTLPAKQHIRFQQRGVSEIYDFTGVTPLFNVPSVLVFRGHKGHKTHGVPTIEFSGKLPRKNYNWRSAARFVTGVKARTNFVQESVAGEYYWKRFLQGATIVPRCLWFIEPDAEAVRNDENPYVRTSESAFENAKKPTKLEGKIDGRFVFQTALSDDILPFGVRSSQKIFLPLFVFKDSIALADAQKLTEHGHFDSANWMQQAERFWQDNSSSGSRSLVDWLNYNQKLTNQAPLARLAVVYNTSGKHLAAALHEKGVHGDDYPAANGFIADAKTYYYYPLSLEEGHYLVAVLNSDVVNDQIKVLQPIGLHGERDIHRRPFEACAISQFDPNNELHTRLAEKGREAADEIRPYLGGFEGKVGVIRNEVRKILKHHIVEINKLVEELLSQTTKEDKKHQSTKKAHKDLFES